MTPLQAIEAATAIAPRTLGPQAPRSGQLAAGYDADIITLDSDPLTDISVLAARPHHRRLDRRAQGQGRADRGLA